MKYKSAFFTIFDTSFRGKPRTAIDEVYGHGRQEEIRSLTDLYPHIISIKNFEDHIDYLQEVEVIFSTWEMPVLTHDQVSKMKKLKIIFYAAGATRAFRQPFWDHGIEICSATSANAIPVAEYTLSQIIMCAKRMLPNIQQCETYEGMVNSNLCAGKGLYDIQVTLLGNGSISSKVQQLLKPFRIIVNVLDVDEMIANPRTLIKAFEESYIVSNHLPNLDFLEQLINHEHFSRMPTGASFINTGRGQQINESDLIRVFTERKDLSALLDVQWPEPPAKESLLYKLPNVYLTPHIAGAYNHEVMRLADYMIDDFKRWENEDELLYKVTEDML